MKITDIHIYGFGKLENFRLKDLSQFSVFYGENETGKSTIMAFIHGVLFGFPTKQQSELRYEPKNNAKYGGRVTIASGSRTFTVERVRGKAAGDITIIYEDGSVGGEEELRKELKGIEKSTYQGVFSFNVIGLQEISRLKEEEINRYLFSSGMTGTDALFKLEEQWQKELDRLFKKSGKKPEINQKLTDLKHLELQLKKAKEKNETYSSLVQKKNILEKVLVHLHEETEKKGTELRQAEALESSWKLLHEYKTVKEKLKKLDNLRSFPVDGLSRLENCQANSSQQESRLQVTKSRLGEIDKKIEEVKPDPVLSSRHAQLSSIMEKRELFIRWNDKAEDQERLKNQLKSRVSQLSRELNIVDITDVQDINLDIATKDRVNSIEDSLNRIQIKKDSLKEAAYEEKNQITYLEERCSELEEKLMEESQFQELQKNVRESKEVDTLKIQYELVREQLNERKGSGKKKSSAQSIIIGMAFSFLAGLLIWSLTESVLGAGVAFTCVLVFSVFFFLKSSDEDNLYWTNLKRKSGELEQKLQEQNKNTDEKKKALLKEQTELRETWKQWVLKLENSEHTLQKLQEEKAKLEVEEEKVLEACGKLSQELHLPSGLNWRLLSEAFEKLKELIKLNEEVQDAAEIHQHCQEKILQYENEIKEAVHDTPVHFTNIEDSLIRIKDALAVNERKAIQYEQLKKQREDLMKEYELINVQLKAEAEEASRLFSMANVETAEEFRQKASAVKEKQSLEQHESLIFSRLGKGLIEAFYRVSESQNDIKAVKERLEKSLSALKQDIQKENEKLAELAYEISVLEEGESYSRLLYRYHEEKTALNELSREWMKYSMARLALQHTIEEYKKEKLPNLMKTAEKYLETLTNGEYTKLTSQPGQHFTIQRCDGMKFTPDELSQGTKEQVYIALRFALVGMLQGIYPLPIIIDDGFVNFDEKRTASVMKLLVHLKEDTQILFFTCHPHILTNLEGADIIQLGSLHNDSLSAAGTSR